MTPFNSCRISNFSFDQCRTSVFHANWGLPALGCLIHDLARAAGNLSVDPIAMLFEGFQESGGKTFQKDLGIESHDRIASDRTSGGKERPRKISFEEMAVANARLPPVDVDDSDLFILHLVKDGDPLVRV